MKIWVDADACPNVIKDMLFRAAQRVPVVTILVANQLIRTPRSRYISKVQVRAGFDEADRYIAEAVEPGDLVITADIPLASQVVDKGGYALNPRGELYTRDNIRQRLGMRNFMEELRSSGVNTGGPASLSQSDRQAFANEFDRFLTRSLNVNSE
ncbi:MAG: YaiI/YqxD family protein [Thiogranum sp.]